MGVINGMIADLVSTNNVNVVSAKLVGKILEDIAQSKIEAPEPVVKETPAEIVQRKIDISGLPEVKKRLETYMGIVA